MLKTTLDQGRWCSWLCLVPIFWLVLAGLERRTSPPIRSSSSRATRAIGRIRFIVFTLAVTPLRKLLGLPDLIRFRRMIGLFAFFYGTPALHHLHLAGQVFRPGGDAEGRGEAAVHHGGLHGVRADDSAGADVHRGMDPAAWAASAGKCCTG